MVNKSVSSLDGKGRVLIPQSLRDAAGLSAGDKVAVALGEDGTSVNISSFREKKLLSLEILLSDSPGALASVAAALAGIGIDLVSTSSRSSKRGEAAVWNVECNPGKMTVPEIRRAVAKAGARVASAKW